MQSCKLGYSKRDHLEPKCRALMSNHYFRVSNPHKLLWVLFLHYTSLDSRSIVTEKGGKVKQQESIGGITLIVIWEKRQTELIKSFYTFLLFVGILLSLFFLPFFQVSL